MSALLYPSSTKPSRAILQGNIIEIAHKSLSPGECPNELRRRILAIASERAHLHAIIVQNSGAISCRGLISKELKEAQFTVTLPLSTATRYDQISHFLRRFHPIDFRNDLHISLPISLQFTIISDFTRRTIGQ